MALRMAPVIRASNNLTPWVMAMFFAGMVFVWGRASAQMDSRSQQRDLTTLDLTKPVPPAEQGFRGIPGGEGGGIVGHGGSKASSLYQLPLEIQVVRSSVNDADQYSIQASVKNKGTQDFELPISRNLTSVEKSGNASQRIFFFLLETVPSETAEPVGVGSAVVGGSASLPGSFLTLAPGRSVNVLLPISIDLLQRALRGATTGQVEVRVFGNEWQLDDNRYSTRASSEKVISKNSITFILRNGRPVAKQK